MATYKQITATEKRSFQRKASSGAEIFCLSPLILLVRFLSRPMAFFFFQLYNSLWVLACSIIPFHCFLSCVLCFQLLTPIFLRSFLTSSSHLALGLHFGLVAYGFHLYMGRPMAYYYYAFRIVWVPSWKKILMMDRKSMSETLGILNIWWISTWDFIANHKWILVLLVFALNFRRLMSTIVDVPNR